MSETRPAAAPSVVPNYLWNVVAFTGDWISFGLAMSFVSASTVLPALVNRLSGSPLLVGLISTVGAGGWLLPQLLAANRVSRLRKKKPAILIPSLFGRPTFLVSALALLWFGVSRPQLALIVFFVGYAAFNLLDGVCSVPWFDLFSRAVPAHRRGRIIGAAQVISAVLTIGVGGVVRYLLGDTSPFAYPANYAALFFLASASLGLSLLFISNIRETPGEAVEAQLTLRDYLGELKVIWTRDRDFRLITAARLLLGLSSLASPFYAVYAINVKGVPASTVGLFLSAQIAGAFVCSIVLGYVLERRGSRLTTNIEVGIVLTAPLLAIVAAFFVPGGSPWFQVIYLLLFAALGAMNNCFMLGHMNYLLEMSPEAKRPIYIGLSNTLAGVLIVVPLLGGWLVNLVSYEPVFMLSALGIAPALLFTLQLREPRAPRVAAEPEPASH